MINEEDIFFIRHAQSELNIASHQFRQKYDVQYDWDVLSKMPEFMDGVRYNAAYIDCSITQKGKGQCQKAREQMNKLEPDVILVSPLERTLETCSRVFKDRNIPVIVEPVLSEAFRTSCDIGGQLQGKKKRFPNYDFTNVEKEGDLWFVKNVCEESQKKYFSHLEQKDPKTHDEKTKIICKFMRDTLIFQTPIQVRQRAKKVKQLLKEYKKKYKQIAVVCHYVAMTFILSKNFDQNDEPEEKQKGPKNCEIRKINLEELCKQ